MALVVGVCALASSSKAQSAPIPTRLDWVTTVCGDDASFASRVLKRTKAVRFVKSGARFTVHLSIEARGSALEARVRIEDPGGPDTVRQIASPNCEDALDAVALVVAISLEARAAELKKATPGSRPQRPRSPPPDTSPEEELASQPLPPAEKPLEPAASSPSESPAPAPVAPMPPAPAAPPPGPAPAAPQPPSATPVPAAPPAPLERAGRDAPATRGVGVENGGRWSLGAGISALFSLGVAPRILIGQALWLRSSWEPWGAWAPMASLGVAHQRLDGFRQPGGAADFALTVANLELCPVRIDAGPLRVRPCTTGSVGQLSASGHQTFSAATRARPWFALGASLQSSVLLGPLELGATLGVARPLVRDSFRFGVPCIDSECSGAFHRVEPLIWTGAVDVGLRF